MAVSFDEARALVLAHARPLGTESVELWDLAGRVLAQPIAAAFDLPRFGNSAMDGFGVHVADVAGASPAQPARLSLAGTSRAGDAPGAALSRGAAVKILTGAAIPPGVEAVVMAEDAEEADGAVLVRRPAKPGENIRLRGEEYRAGDVVLATGTRATPPVVGLLATFGLPSAEVCRLPKVAVVVTGSELAEPGQSLQEGCIYDANTYTLRAALTALGIHDPTCDRVDDTPGATRESLRSALDVADVVLAVGGVSVGEYDLVKEVCADLGVQTRFWQVAMKPAKPTYFGTYSDGRARETLVFGLPGNPVAVLVAYHQFVRPALLAMMGASDIAPTLLPAALTTPVRKKRGRLEFLRGRARVEDGKLVVTPTTGQGSHMLGGLAQANCLLHLLPEAEGFAPGDTVNVEFLSWER